jgi:phosphatidate phosphatase PAH1
MMMAATTLSAASSSTLQQMTTSCDISVIDDTIASVCCGTYAMLLTQGEASDVILVVNNNNNKTTTILACSDFYVQFPDTNNDNTTNRITITVNGSLCDDSMNMSPTKNGGSRFIRGNSWKPPSLTSLYDKLVLGKNMIRYSLVHNTRNQVLGIVEANLFVWDFMSNIIVCDIDGTITEIS